MRHETMMNPVKSYAFTLSADALLELFFAVPFAFGIGAATHLHQTGIPLIATGLLRSGQEV